MRLDAALVKRLLADRIGGQIDPVVFCRIIDCRRLGRYAAPQQQVLHRDELIALGQQIVDRGQRTVHAGLVNVMDQNDRAVKDTGFDIAAHRLCIAVLPVFRVDRPVDQRRGHDGFDRFVRVAVGGADIRVFVASGGGDERLHGADLICDRLRGAGVKVFVIVCMVCKLVALVYDALQRLRPAGGVDAVDKKRRVNAALGKAVQKRAGIFAGPVVKRDGQQLRAAVLRPVRPRGQTQCRQQTQRQSSG